MRTRSGLPKHCSWNIDRHGKRRVRFRKGGFTTYLTGTPWSEDFMRQYAAAADGVKAQARNIGAARTVAGTVNAFVAAYLDLRSSSPFKTAAAETQRTRRNMLENFRKAYGDKPVFRTDNSGRRTMLLTREHVQRIVNEKAATPFAQRNFLNTLRAMFKWAAKEGRIPYDPTLGVTREKVKTTGYKTRSEDHIGRFEAKHPIGTKARLAFAFLLYTGQRRGDVVRIGRQHVYNGVLTIDQGKTEGGEESHLEIPVHPKLQEIIDATPTVGVKTFLVTSATGFAIYATQPNVRMCLHMDCGKQPRAVLPRSDAARTRLRQSPATPRFLRCSATRRRQIGNAWRAKLWQSWLRADGEQKFVQP